jgi:hypothetical protein
LATVVRLRATLRLLPTFASLRVLGLSFGDLDFFAPVSGSMATVRTGFYRGVSPNGEALVDDSPRPSITAPVEVSVARPYIVEVAVGASALLNALGDMASRRSARIEFITNVGRFVAVFDTQVRALREWAPLLSNARAPEATALYNAREMQCTMAQVGRLVNVSRPADPFPLASLSTQEGLPAELIELYGPSPVDSPVIRPIPDAGEPRPILPFGVRSEVARDPFDLHVNRPWLYGPPASPVPRLEPIVDLALRAGRPQPVTPSV